MNISDLHITRLYQLNEQGKGPFLRQTKHFEETSELAEAVYMDHPPEKIASEAIDGLLMLLSIAADYVEESAFPQQLSDAIDYGSTMFSDAVVHTAELKRVSLGFSTLAYIATLQHVTTAVQKYEGVASSSYKGDANPLTVLLAIIDSTAALSNLFAHIMLLDLDLDLQQIYDEKMDKWEKVSK